MLNYVRTAQYHVRTHTRIVGTHYTYHIAVGMPTQACGRLTASIN